MFRVKESSNRIELSQLVQDLLNFGVLGSLQLWGWGVGGCGWGGWMSVGDGWGCPPHRCTCTCMHIRTRACGKHDNFMEMAASIGFLGNPWEFPMMSYTCALVCACMHVHTCACVWGAPSYHPPIPIHPPPTPQGGTFGITQNSIVLELIGIFQFCLKI